VGGNNRANCHASLCGARGGKKRRSLCKQEAKKAAKNSCFWRDADARHQSAAAQVESERASATGAGRPAGALVLSYMLLFMLRAERV
jgi:hypothetical protein